jgi:tetratricopeptide (TPR) repeat protein
MRFANQEVAVLTTAREGRHAQAREMLDTLRASPARCALLSGMMYGWEGNHSMAAEVLGEGIQCIENDPDTAAMLYVELSQEGVYLNDRKLMREVYLRFYQLFVRFPGNKDIQYWSPSILGNVAHHHERNMEYQRAVDVAGEALTSFSMDAHQWCHAVSARLVRAWSYAEMGETSKAHKDLEGAKRLDRDGTLSASIMLAEGRILVAEGEYAQAEQITMRAESLAHKNTPTLWPEVVEAKYVQMLAALLSGRSDAYTLAKEVRDTGLKHRLRYIPGWVSRALSQYAAREAN